MSIMEIVNLTKTKNVFFELNKLLDIFEQHKLYPDNKILYIGLSGGSDSVFLLLMAYVMRQYDYLNQVYAIHINHGTRKENKQEEDFCLKLCQSLNIKCFIEKLDSLVCVTSSFENAARVGRYKLFEKHLSKGSYLATGHHLDDSFEWSLMNLFKTASIDSLKGIPIKREPYIRPLLSFSKEEILNFLQRFKISYKQDPSNTNNKYERNYIRNLLLPLIKEKFPQYLKHFELRSSQIYNLSQELEEIQQSYVEKHVVKNILQGVEIECLKFSSQFELIFKKEYFKLVGEGRSSISLEVRKIKQAMYHGKEGPLNFPKNINVYIMRNTLYLLPSSKLKIYEKLDNILLERLKKTIINDGQFNKLLSQIDLKLDCQRSFFPHIILLQNTNKNNVKKRHVLLPKSTQFLLDQKIKFTYLARISKSNVCQILSICDLTLLQDLN